MNTYLLSYLLLPDATLQCVNNYESSIKIIVSGNDKECDGSQCDGSQGLSHKVEGAKFLKSPSYKYTFFPYEFRIACDRSKLAFVGTLNSIGQLLGLPLAGFVADRYGRKFVIIAGCFVSATSGIFQSFCNNYTQFLVLELTESVGGVGIYQSAIILGVELVSTKQRSLTTAILCAMYSFGPIAMAGIMWWCKDWRILLRILYIPGLFFIFYIWLIPESVRWLQTKGQHNKVLKILRNAASINKKTALKTVLNKKIATLEAEYISKLTNKKNIEENTDVATLFKTIFGSKILFFRMVICSYCWIASTLVYYGISLNTVELAVGNKYLNFILAGAIEIPAGFLILPILEKVPRRLSQLVAFLCTGLALVFCEFVPADLIWMKLVLYLFSKFNISISASIIYLHTAEIFPTELRLSMVGLCSTIGRIGCIVAPQTPLLKDRFGSIAPILLFGVVSILASILVLLLPETRGMELKDTMKEVENKDSFK